MTTHAALLLLLFAATAWGDCTVYSRVRTASLVSPGIAPIVQTYPSGTQCFYCGIGTRGLGDAGCADRCYEATCDRPSDIMVSCNLDDSIGLLRFPFPPYDSNTPPALRLVPRRSGNACKVCDNVCDFYPNVTCSDQTGYAGIPSVCSTRSASIPLHVTCIAVP